MKQKETVSVPLVVTQRINEILANNPLIVLEEVLERMDLRMQQAEWRAYYGVNEDWHRQNKTCGLYDQGCGCAFCKALHRYVSTKVSAHRLQRRLDDYDYMCRPYEFTEPYRHLKLLSEEWPRLRAIKEQIRALTGL